MTNTIHHLDKSLEQLGGGLTAHKRDDKIQ
jgi:hypothetical protein